MNNSHSNKQNFQNSKKSQENESTQASHLYKNLDLVRLEEIDSRLESDKQLLEKFEESPAETLKEEGFVIPANMTVRYDESYGKDLQSAEYVSASGENAKPSRFEVRIGHIVISE